ncbi:probable galaptin lec-8 [Haliotis rufescens]|uniref:probable galaptin lec-8 n=1 Tax=Haliotis rufescens TaxID=6454 RepID=UPI00201F9971|nr:probable galaptin lec-8 [Haliotis rufescens]
MCRNSSSVCKASRKWSGWVGPCDRYRWDNPDVTRLSMPCKPVSRFKLTLYVTPTAATRMVVSVRGNGGNRLCHYEFRMDTSAVVINTRNSTRQWGSEIRLTHVPLALGVQSVMEITLEEGIYRLSVNGNGIYNFTERYPDVSPRNVDVEGDVRMKSAEITL